MTIDVISCAEAKSAGMKRYFTGRQCKHGHIAPRSVSNGTCCECQLVRATNAYHGSREAKIESRMARYRANREQEQIKMREHYSRNKEVAREQRKIRYYSDPEKAREDSKTWARNNPVRRREQHALRRAAKANATPSWLTREHRKMILAVYHEARKLEVETGVPHHVDHIIPLISTVVCGLHVPWNLRAIPANDNMKKSNKVAV